MVPRTFFVVQFAQESFDHVNDWLSEVNRYASEGTSKLLIGEGRLSSEQLSRAARAFVMYLVDTHREKSR